MTAAQVVRATGFALIAAGLSAAFVIVASGPGWGLLIGPPATAGIVLVSCSRERR